MRRYTLLIISLALTAAVVVWHPASVADAPAATGTTSPTTTTIPAAPAVNHRTFMETGVATTTTVAPLGFEPVCGEALMRLALHVGWPANQLPMLDRVARLESGADCGNTDTNLSLNQADPMGGSRGTMQINGFWCSRTRYNTHVAGWLGERGILASCADLHNVTVNLRAALLLWQRSGWQPWGF